VRTPFEIARRPGGRLFANNSQNSDPSPVASQSQLCWYSTRPRYAAGTLKSVESYFGGAPIREEYLIVDGGVLAGADATSYKLT